MISLEADLIRNHKLKKQFKDPIRVFQLQNLDMLIDKELQP